jgi:hypothetical protein
MRRIAVFKVFYSLICRYRYGEISRMRFVLEWEREQRRQGTAPGGGVRV